MRILAAEGFEKTKPIQSQFRNVAGMRIGWELVFSRLRQKGL